MSIITIEKASVTDAEQLTAILKRTFDEEANKWLTSQENIIDFNIVPPGYSSVEVTKYMIRELFSFKILYDQEIVGGIVITISGEYYGRIDRIYIDPNYQGKGIGSRAITLAEEQFPYVRIWDLETSSKQINNHYFYEKMGYRTTYKTDEEYGYQKTIKTLAHNENLIKNQNIPSTQCENCDMMKMACYAVNLEGSSFSNSTLAKIQISNCNLSHSKFQNINLRNALFADLNLSNSEMTFVTLGGVRFVDTVLGNEKTPITFERCDLEGSQFTNSNLRNVEIHASDLTGMKIDNVPVEELIAAYNQLKK